MIKRTNRQKNLKERRGGETTNMEIGNLSNILKKLELIGPHIP